jgi:hypothetical protein
MGCLARALSRSWSRASAVTMQLLARTLLCRNGQWACLGLLRTMADSATLLSFRGAWPFYGDRKCAAVIRRQIQPHLTTMTKHFWLRLSVSAPWLRRSSSLGSLIYKEQNYLALFHRRCFTDSLFHRALFQRQLFCSSRFEPLVVQTHFQRMLLYRSLFRRSRCLHFYTVFCYNYDCTSTVLKRGGLV